uniref:uncharacterized protein LOC122594595 n=1 Tax=Erigeron canadensis TaxID=72917 RepID=UPI001CB96751|nr:uncharacterized protein LOC122594595 [Erigeron canadensis]
MTPAKEAAAILKRLREKKEEILERVVREEERITAESLKEWKAKSARTEEIAARTKQEEEWKTNRIKENSSMRLVLYSYNGRVNRVVKLEEFEVDELCVVESLKIRELVLEDQSRVLYTDIDSRVLQQVMDFCKERATVKCSGTEDLLKAFDSMYLQQLSSTHWSCLSKILCAACTLEIPSLADLTSTAIVNMVGEKDTRVILKMFHFARQNISLEEMEQGREDLQYWAKLK